MKTDLKEALRYMGVKGAPDPSVLALAKQAEEDEKSVGEYQKEVLKNPAVWMLALSSAFMYISRYAVNSWGIFYSALR